VLTPAQSIHGPLVPAQQQILLYSAEQWEVFIQDVKGRNANTERPVLDRRACKPSPKRVPLAPVEQVMAFFG
jgi:hypothetical protein